MQIIEPGHIYRLTWLDGSPRTVTAEGDADETADLGQTEADLIFVCREETDELQPHAGTQTQEVLRALIDRTMHCDNCLRWAGNDKIIYHLRMALALHEARALERKTEKGLIRPELIRTSSDGHFKLHGGKHEGDAQRYHEKEKS
jgi:hypothetical protein